MDFSAYAAQPDEALDLLEGALLIAADAHPGLDTAAVVRDLDELAAPLAGKQLGRLPAVVQARALADHLFLHAGFHGNGSDYYDPRNSFLNDVLARRTGIPISLSVLYIEIARRIGVQASPVGFPGHFLVRIDDDSTRPLMVDPFHGGNILQESALRQILARSGSTLTYDPSLITPTPVRHVIARMLMNLRGIYASRADYARLLVVFDRLIDLLPNAAEDLRDRGFLFARLGAPDAALNDLSRYLERAPGAPDADEVRRWMTRISETARATPSS